MPASQRESIAAFNQLVDNLIALKDGHPDAAIMQELNSNGNDTDYIGLGKEVVINGLGYLLLVNGWASQTKGCDYLQRNLMIEALSPLEQSERRGEAVRYINGSFTVFSGVREGTEALHESPVMDSDPREALVAPFGEWAVNSVTACEARGGPVSSHPDPYGRMLLENHPTPADLARILEFAASAEHVYATAAEKDGWVSTSTLLVPLARPS